MAGDNGVAAVTDHPGADSTIQQAVGMWQRRCFWRREFFYMVEVGWGR